MQPHHNLASAHDDRLLPCHLLPRPPDHLQTAEGRAGDEAVGQLTPRQTTCVDLVESINILGGEGGGGEREGEGF